MSYTKGEWKEMCMGSEGYAIYPVNDIPLTELRKQDNWKDRIHPIAQLIGEWERQKANAHLIAAAPDMYDALKSIYDGIMANQERLGAGRFDKLTEALIKAEGK